MSSKSEEVFVTVFEDSDGNVLWGEKVVEVAFDQNLLTTTKTLVSNSVPEDASVLKDVRVLFERDEDEPKVVSVVLNTYQRRSFFIRFDHTDDSAGQLRRLDISRPSVVTISVDRRKKSQVSVHVDDVNHDPVAVLEYE